ncbi:ABC transporter ATP-binding protein [Phaeocystidibacter luteus]|uniref:ABC transporter ATP-binding protein n=1 Tax=Phaeocystidibacter luteus TaxID=911197 RepID=A0A6N6RL72_9FLAO|nr:ABC transporter ATP-binding protein [Phaeocystidibacter luteus]KAB2813851.1 ABC transporter ATP-binding protein [Phaeocystidibacter luteus]
MKSTETVVKVENLRKTYNADAVAVHAVDGISLSIEKGEFTAIVGPSGCGKTTLLNMIGGLDRPTSGDVYVQEVSIGSLSEGDLIDFRLKHIGFVFQAYNLLPVLSAEENTSFIMQLQGKSKEERSQRARQLLKNVGLEGREGDKPAQLSGGQQQRVAVARALASKPNFIIADEPTANLDSHSTSNLLDIMARLNEEEQMTFVFATHDQRVIDKAKRVITLEDGKVITDEIRS